MADYRSEESIGARIKAARRQRGYRTTRDLADAIPGGKITAAILENIESGRKADLNVSQLLNIARALDVPPSILLAPIGKPDRAIDLPNLSDDFANMSAAEFDSWISATPASSYRPRLAAERVDIDLLGLSRELGTMRRELDRLQVVFDVQMNSADDDLVTANQAIGARIDATVAEIARLSALLESAGVDFSTAAVPWGGD